MEDHLTAAEKRRAEAVGSCIWHQVEKQEEEEKGMMMRRTDGVGRV